MRILVVGAGPVGLTTALTLAHRGLHCRIVERRTKPSDLSRAVGITPDTISMLKSIDGAQGILNEAMSIDRAIFKRHAKTLFEVEAKEFGSDTPTMLGLPQNRTEEILRDCLSAIGIGVEYGHAVQSVELGTDTANVVFENGETAQFDWIVAADGVRSTVRQCLNISYTGYDIAGKWAIADIDVDGKFDHHAVTVYSYGGNFGLVLPIEEQRARVVSTTDDALAALPEPLPIGNVRREATFELSVRKAETFRRQRVLLAGDAAHCHSPIGGRGMNLGMADGFAAANAIVDKTVESYSTQRHAEASKIISMSERARRILTSSNPLASLGFWCAGKLLRNSKTARRFFWKNLTGT